jgi:succinate dehydrogenase/fumarate reductase flavoprotein subunit
VTHHDVVIVGAGVAGLTGARRSQQLGRSVAIVERCATGPGVGNGRLSGGWFHAAMLDPVTRTPEELYERVLDVTDGTARPEVVRAWADNVRRALGFLTAEGGAFATLDPADEAQHNVLMPARAATIGQPWERHGPDLLLSAMWRRFLDAGGSGLTGRRARELIVDGDTVIGVRTDSGEEVTGAAVLLADGGFQANPELVARYITTEYKLRGSPHDTGDALQMGLAVGANTTNMDVFYGYALSRDALRDDRLWPHPSLGWLIANGVVVDGAGHRFVDETASGELVANAIARCSTPGSCWVVVDAATWDTVGRLGEVPPNPTLLDVGATVVSASSPEELAAACELPADALAATLADVAAGPCEPARERPCAVDPSDLRAIPLIAGITFAMGGLAVNRHAQVLDHEDRPIPGLYAAGGAMGGLQGGPRVGVAGGWSEAATFALLAAEHLASSGTD